MNRVIFNLKRHWPMPDGSIVDLYEEIKAGRKTSEWRDATDFWFRRLCNDDFPRDFDAFLKIHGEQKAGVIDLTRFLKVSEAWLVISYPKGSLPRFEVDVKKLLWHLYTRQLEIQFANVQEVTA